MCGREVDWDPAEGTECYVRGVEYERWARHLINVELGTKVKEEARRLARQTAGESKEKVGGNPEGRGGQQYQSLLCVTAVWFGAGRVSLRTVRPSGAIQTGRNAAVSIVGVVVPR